MNLKGKVSRLEEAVKPKDRVLTVVAIIGKDADGIKLLGERDGKRTIRTITPAELEALQEAHAGRVVVLPYGLVNPVELEALPPGE